MGIGSKKTKIKPSKILKGTLIINGFPITHYKRVTKTGKPKRKWGWKDLNKNPRLKIAIARLYGIK